MQHTNGSGYPPAFHQSHNGNSHIPTRYSPGRIVPVRPPPLPKSQGSPDFSSPKPENSATFSFSAAEQRQQAEVARKRHRNALICVAISCAIFFILLIACLAVAASSNFDENCPDQNPTVKQWNPGHDPQRKVVIGKGEHLSLGASATVHSITIQNGGSLVFADDKEGSKNITLKTRFIHIREGGALHIGADKCHYKSKATIILYGKSDESEDLPLFGKKFIGVEAGGLLELHGTKKLSWTQLAKTLPASGLPSGSYSFKKDYSRGFNVRVIDQDTAQVLYVDKFDTHEPESESIRLHTFLKALDPGRIVAIAVGDSAAKSLLSDTKQTLKDLLGSAHVNDLSFRQSWALVGVIGDRTSNSSEAVQDYVNHNTAEQALARREFTTVNGVDFSVSAYSEWIEGTSWVGFNVEVADGTVLDLLDDVTNWREGDRIVIASTDYSMYQAEEFTLLPCPKCTKHQVKIKEKPQFPHVGEILDGVDMRAEVGILSRNIVIQGEMEGSCYGSNMCQFFNTDTFGGHIQILKNFTSVHLSNVELKNMGQQAQKKYPLHFHLCGDVDVKGGYRSPTYVDSLSIHHCFSRCLGIHATNGLLVKDTIGYDTLGHCFFLEDGIEERNVLFHNLGLLTKPGTQLPTDRNDTMCTEIRDKVYGKYIPVPATDCKAVSTFWIANPNNHLISNAAAGSQDTGMWYLFHSMSTGDSHGLYPETKAELTPLGKFYNNRVHSNFKAGLFIDKGVKTTHANSEDPREYLCLDNNARFRPHEIADPSKPRVPALIESLITFKNNDHGAWVRGGDITITNSAFADNGIGLTFASDGSFPKDEGASQTVLESLFIGESKNYGFPGGQNKYFGTGWPGNRNRTLPRNKTFPIRGFQIYDGPVHLTRSTFRNFVSTSDRYTSAIGFFMKNAWQLTPKNKVSLVKLDINVSLKVFFCKPGPWFEDCKQDGDKNAVFNDFDGSVSGYKDMLVGRLDNFLIRNPDCINVTDWNGIICKGKYAQIYVQTWNPANNTMSIVRDEYPDFPMLLRGINQNHRATFQQYQPVVMLQKDYTVHWNGKAPENIVIYLINFDKNDWIRIALCYPRDTIFQVKSDVYQRLTKVVSMVEEYTAASSIKDFLDSQAERKYFFDNSTGLLFIYLQARNERDGQSYCSSFGCERLNITATIRSEQVSNCMAEVDQKYRKTPTIISPVPLNNSVSVPCRACGTSQVIFSSDPERTYIPVQVKSLSKVETDQGDLEAFISVNGTKMKLYGRNTFVVTVDACTGKIAGNRTFLTKDTALIVEYLTTGIPQKSIVLLAVRSDIPGEQTISEALVSLGTAKAAKLKDKGSLALYGFKGHFKPSWVELFTSPAGQGLGIVEKYIPIQLEEYGCTKVVKIQRKDLEILKKLQRAQ